ncbi:hypothetical protein SARC_08945 [Sphaeroforma arctica JP610]|uniref:Uncharacterized protein n=1 Tax=Sphaeroforma arctica JP610 TaxID=667725 RepID=A0A0L0FPB3_9EUKA|nr:hypothetical protein SARC_08945 [Sphaeroforma arctica JP610]KNC78637.1 hypothetical protein SARC_08945 [Sphaeroforma arctica JP610]|eukprot:XP_014152539.1 hypothetical protein SARC_08945 [Sphaeroforma arctica JP610]
MCNLKLCECCIVQQPLPLRSKSVKGSKDVAVGSYFCMVVLDWEYQARTQTKAQASAPFWGEKFTFSNFPSSLKTLMVVIYQNERTFTGGSKEVPVGKVSISVDTLAKTESFTQWCSIEDMKSNNFINGSLRLELQYSHEVVRPTEDYTELVNCLSYPDVLRCLNVMIPPKQRERTAKHMLKIYRARGEADRLVSSLCQIEIASTDNPNILFRGNSLATKAVDQYTKLVAMAYLHQVLTPIITQIYNCTESCEVDPTRLNNNQTQMAENWKRLLGFTEQLQKDAEGHFQEEENIRYTVIAGVFFLRFIVPAILNPKLFNMMPGHPSDTVGRTLMLVAKTIQNLSNLVLFGAKEPYMNPMNVFIESNLEAMKNVIDRLCWTRENEELSPPPVIDEGIEMAMLYRVLVNIGRGLVNYQEENKGEDIEPLLVALGEIKNLMFHG